MTTTQIARADGPGALPVSDLVRWRKSDRKQQCYARLCLARIPAGVWFVRIGDFLYCAACWRSRLESEQIYDQLDQEDEIARESAARMGPAPAWTEEQWHLGA